MTEPSIPPAGCAASRRGYRFGPFHVDPGRRVLLRDGKPVALTAKAFDVLLFMVRNPGRLLSKEELFEAVWPEVAVEEGNLARNVSTLRGALGERPAEHRYIVTDFGRGYRFVGAVEPVLDDPPPADPAASTHRRRAAATRLPRERGGRRLLLVATGVLALAALVVLGYRYPLWPRVDAGGAISSLAILPLAEAADGASTAMAQGLAESLATDLSREAGLRIVSRIVAQPWAAEPLDVRRIGQELGVQALVVGRIERMGDGFLVEVELVGADDVRRVWGRRFPPGEMDLVMVERAIVAGIRGELGLTSPPVGILAGVGTDDPEAYRLYLLGRHEWKRLTEAGLRASLDYYRRALEVDPGYALALTGIADAHVALGMAFAHPRESFAEAKEAALRALELDATLAPAYVSLGAVRLFYEWDWEGAAREVARARALERSYRDAIEVNTAYGEAFHYYCGYLEVMGRWDEAVAEIRRGLEIDPHSALLGAELAWSYYVARRFDDSAAQARAVIASDPEAALAHSVLGAAYVALGRADEAVAVLESAVGRFENDPLFIGELGYAYAIAGRADAARASLQRLAALGSTRYVDPYFTALVHAGLDEDDRALAALEAAYTDRSPWVTWLTVEPRMDDLRELPRFAELVARVHGPGRGSSAL